VGSCAVHRRHLLFLCLVASCASDADPPVVDPCADKPVVAGGSAEIGLGTTFAPVVAGQDVELQLGTQGLWMFVVNARARDMDVGSGGREGVIEVAALDQNGQQISLGLGCRVREFAEMDGGNLQLTSPFFLPLLPTVSLGPEGAMVTIRLDVRDGEGRRATDERSIVAHLPAQGP
jgi:hypothetical protein